MLLEVFSNLVILPFYDSMICSTNKKCDINVRKVYVICTHILESNPNKSVLIPLYHGTTDKRKVYFYFFLRHAVKVNIENI